MYVYYVTNYNHSYKGYIPPYGGLFHWLYPYK